MPPELTEYLEKIGALRKGEIYLERRFTAADSWKNISIDEGYRFRGAFREYAPDLSEVLKNSRVVIAGDPGLGKSTTAEAVARYFAGQQPLASIPILASLKSYGGNLQQLLVKVSSELILSLNEVEGNAVRRYYILDGLDEIPSECLSAFTKDVKTLLDGDKEAGFLATSRQAFYFENRSILPFCVSEFLMLEFSDEDVWNYAMRAGVPDVKAFISAVQEAGCSDEAANPFILRALVQRYLDSGKLGDRKSDNVNYMVDKLIRTRPAVNAYQQRRALRMLAVALETWCRNEISVEDARRVLREASQLSDQEADNILNELLTSILVHTSNGIAFQTRSFGEFLAADQLAAADLDRVRELAFLGGDKPHPSWQNAISYLAEQNVSVRRFFSQNHPEWLLSSSPAAFSEAERRAVVTGVLARLNEAEEYILGHPVIKSFSVARFLTPDLAAVLHRDLDSNNPQRKANALLLLGLNKDPTVIPACLQIATDSTRHDSLRFSAIVSLINCGTRNEIQPLIDSLTQADPFRINVADCIGSLATEQDIARVLPIILDAGAMLSNSFYRFREFKTREALLAALQIGVDQPQILMVNRSDSYLKPIFNLLHTYWDSEIADKCGQLLICMEKAGIYPDRSGLTGTLVSSIAKHDAEGLAAQVYLEGMLSEGRRSRYLADVVGPVMTPANARWLIRQNAPLLIEDLAYYVKGSARAVLSPHSQGVIPAQDQGRESYTVQMAT